MTNLPETNLARRLAEKYHLQPPVDIDKLARRFARLEVTRLPADLDVDGATFDLKVSRKRPTIIVNQNRPRSRRRFTIAHELGHVLIPWHIGSILDEVVLTTGREGTAYWVLESEANRFASEVLVPTGWTSRILEKLKIPSTSLEHIVTVAEVSPIAAAIALTNSMPEGYIYALLDDDQVVISSGRSEGTLANAPPQGASIDRHSFYPARDGMWESRQADGTYVWWHLAREVTLPTAEDQRGWREVLDDIVADMRIPENKRLKFKQSVNGIFAYANGRATTRTPQAIYSAALQRFHSHAFGDVALTRFVKHKQFRSFLRGRSEAVLNKV